MMRRAGAGNPDVLRRDFREPIYLRHGIEYGFISGEWQPHNRFAATAAIGHDIDAAAVPSFTNVLNDPNSNDRCKASASYVLTKIVPPSLSIPALVSGYERAAETERKWFAATIGQIPALNYDLIRPDEILSGQLRILQLLSPDTNWTKADEHLDKLSFVGRQEL